MVVDNVTSSRRNSDAIDARFKESRVRDPPGTPFFGPLPCSPPAESLATTRPRSLVLILVVH